MKMEETEEKAHSYILTVYLGLFANIKINFEDWVSGTQREIFSGV